MLGIPARYLKEIYIRNIGIVIVAAIIPSVMPEIADGHSGPTMYLKSYVYTFLFWQGDYKILCWFRRLYPSIGDTMKRLGLTIVVATLYTLSVETVLGFGLSHLGFDEPFSMATVFDHAGIDFTATLIVGTLYESNYFFHNWKRTLVETEKLKTQNLKSQLDVLKNQISPHFLFNSLNTLIALIQEDPKVATDFTEELSKVYRYILLYKNKELVPLKTELDFTKSFTFLLKMRFSEGVRFNYNVDERYLNHSIAPLTLQMLIENAIKHNVTSLGNPLVVDIYVENGQSIVVRNNLQLKHHVNDSTHTGLVNIQKRYSYLSDLPVDIIKTNKYFMVSLPLLKVEPTESELVVEEG